MKRTLLALIASMMLAAPVCMAQDYNVWITTEGAGLQISSGDRYYLPPPPPRYDRHHAKKYHKKLRKRAKEYRKAQKKYYKAQRKYYESMRHGFHHDWDDD